MKHKYKILFATILLFTTIITTNMFALASNAANEPILVSSMNKNSSKTKRGEPPYDYIIGKDKFPHFRIFFWVPLSATKYIPYADDDINTDISHHGPVDKWSVVETDDKNDKEKLVYIFVPKTFVFLHGKSFYKLIHLSTT